MFRFANLSNKLQRSRDKKRSPYPLLVLAGSMLCGCVFFENSFDPCVDQQSCVSASDGSTGGQDVRGDGGATSGGDGNTMLADTGGADSSGGTGGGAGSGGAGTGGSNTGGASSAPRPDEIYAINEMTKNKYVELYIKLGPVETTHLYLSSGTQTQPNYADACSLGGLGTLNEGSFAEVSVQPACVGGGLCVSNCGFTFVEGDFVYLLTDESGEYVPLVSMQYPVANAPTIGTSYSAVPDGSTTFQVASPTPGASNN